MTQSTVAVLGASTDRRKYGNKAVRAYRQLGYDVYPVNPRAGEIEGLTAYATLDEVPADHLDRILVYLPPTVGMELLDDIRRKGADEVWFNPGSESPELIARATEIGLDVIQACSIVNVGMLPDELPDD